MKYLPFWIGLVFISLQAVSQQSTEIYLMDIKKNTDSIQLSAPLNISNNEGYDNQPSFLDDDTILFASTRNNQTDIALYTISTGSKTWVSNTSNGSEYSPLKIPEKEAVSAIRLDTDGLQRLYEYDLRTGTSKELIKDLKIGYHLWYNDHMLVCTVLIENRMDLVVVNLKEGTNYTVAKNVGRSLHKIPNSDLISFVSKESQTNLLKSLHPSSGVTKELLQLLDSSEDVCWTPNGKLLSAFNSTLIVHNPNKELKWDGVAFFNEDQIQGISRLAVSPKGNYVALVSNDPPAAIVQKQVDSYNAGNLDAFVNCYAKNVLVTNFPVDTLYVGHKKMRNNYSSLAPDNKVYEVYVANRITIGNKVIDQESVKRNGTFQQMQVALYEVDNHTISSMRFIFDKPNLPNPETIVQKQLDAYNARDINGFMDTYSNDIELFNFPAELRTTGIAAMRKGYGDYFDSSPDLHAEIKNRIVIGNMVIDEEEVTANGNTFKAVAIYEVENGKISRVTFVR